MAGEISSGGGAATHAGTNYQDYVAAWVAVQILAEQDVAPHWGLPATVTIDALHAEAPNPIDDLTVQTSAHGRALSQAKHTTNLETTGTSPLGSTIAQFVAEYCAPKSQFDPTKDRFVLITSPQSSAGIRTDLPAFLTRMRTSSQPDAEWTSDSADQQHAATVLRNHIVREWQLLNGATPNSTELTGVTRLMHIHVLDVDPGGQAAQEAKNTLRQRILKDATAADLAWNTLITATGSYAANHQRADRPALQQALIDAGLDLQAPRSYREDIERLIAHTASTLTTLLDFSHIEVGTDVVTVQRAPAASVQTAAADGHLLILGAPGAGKSGALYEFANTLRFQGADVVLFAVDQLEAASPGNLRNELGLTHELTTVLAAWPSTAPGYLIIDALDAARTESATKTLHTIMGRVIAANNRWHVIASVRKFDLRYNKTFQHLFKGTPPSPHTDQEFTTTRHVNIPTLTDAELAQVGQQSPDLTALITAAPARLRELLRLPFNLRLLAELLGSGISPAELQPLQTQIELLGRYWHERIIRNDGNGDARELVLRRTTDAMVAQRSLRVARAAAIESDTASSAFLDDLLSTHVLAEWTTHNGTAQREFLTFPHHLLFDYAVARCTLPPDHQPLIARLTAEPDLLIAIRPSIDLHYQRLWHHDQQGFWDLTFRTLNAPIPEIGKLIGPSVAALHATSLQQTQPLLDHLQDPTKHKDGIAALQHIFATLVTHGSTSPTTLHGPWIAFLDQATTTLTPKLTNSIRPYTILLTEHADDLAPPNRERLGRIARRILVYALKHGDMLLMINSINAVTKTITTDPAASLTILRACITEEHLTTYGYRTLPTLARTVSALAAVDATFIRDAYVSAFRYQDESKDATSMGDSQILPMKSNRKQDYDLGLWQLDQEYFNVLNLQPHDAIDALLTIIDDYVKTEHKPATAAVPIKFNGRDTSLLQDYSSIWDKGLGSQHDNPIAMLNTFQTFLEGTTDEHVINEYLQQVADHHPPAVIWRRLLAAGANQPATIGYALRSLTWDHNILIEYDTTRLAGKLLQAIHATLDESERERVEHAIMAIPSTEGVNVEAANNYRDRLLGCLDPTLLVTAPAQGQRASMTQHGGPPSNDEAHPIAEWRTLDPTPTTADPLLEALLKTVSAFAQEHLSLTPSAEAITTVLPSIKALGDTIANPSTVFPAAFVDQSFTELARSILAISRADDVTAEQATILLPIILRATTQESPTLPEDQDQARPVTGWNSAPRISAADGITVLARHPSCCTDETRDAIRKLSNDPVPAVRVQVATRILCLYKTDPELMWDLLHHYVEHEPNPTVLTDALHALARLPATLADKTVPLTVTIFNRASEGPDTESIREACIYLFCGLSLWVNDATCNGTLDRLIANPLGHAPDLQRLIFCLGGYLPAKEQRVTDAAFALLHRVLDSVIETVRTLEATHPATAPWPPEAQEQYGSLLRCADSVAQRLYFASGAFKNANEERVVLPAHVFYESAQPLFKLLATIGHPHVAHYVLDTLKHFIAVDPPGVLLIVGDVVHAGSKYGYQYEQLAEGLMVEFVEQYLAEYRPLLRERQDCHTALMDILDIFVRVGWPRAHRLTYQLSDIYR